MKLSAIQLVAVSVVVVSCSPNQSIAGHRFDVPREHLVDLDLPWLPRPEGEGLLFTLDPKRQPQDAVSALVEPKDRVCGDQTAFEQPVCKASPLWDASKWNQPSNLRRQADALDGGTQWEYVTDALGDEIVIAKCFGPVNDGGGLCSTAVRYGDDLFVTIGYPEKRLSELGILIAETQRLLSSWER